MNFYVKHGKMSQDVILKTARQISKWERELQETKGTHFPCIVFSQMAKEARHMSGFLWRQGFALNRSWCAVRST